MKDIMSVLITKPGGGERCVNKDFELPFALYVGMQIECIAWKGAREVKNVKLSFDEDYEDQCLYVHLGKDETKSAEEQKQFFEMYKGQGWRVPGE